MIRKKLYCLCCLFIVGVMVLSCAQDGNIAEASTPDEARTSPFNINLADVEAIMEKAQPLIEKASGFKFQKEIDCRLVDRATFRDASVEQLNTVLKKKMKGMDDDTIARQAELIATNQSQRWLAIYSPDEEILQVIPENGAVQAKLYEIDEDEFDDFLFLYLTYRVLGIVNDQEFDFRGNLEKAKNSEASEALSAVSNGYSVYIFNKIAEGLGVAEPLKEKVLKSVAGITNETNPMQQQNYALMYEKGSEFVATVLNKEGPEGIKRVFEFPPTSTGQILNPETYFAASENPGFDCFEMMEKVSGFLPIEGLQSQKSEIGASNLAMILVAQGISQQEANEIAGACLGGASTTALKQAVKPVMIVATVLNFQTGDACMDYVGILEKLEISSRAQIDAMLNAELNVVSLENPNMEGFDAVKYQQVETTVDGQVTTTFSAEGIVDGFYLSVMFINPEQDQNQKTVTDILTKMNKERLSMM